MPQLPLPTPAPAPPGDGPLTDDEISALSRLGWEVAEVRPDGKITMRDMQSEGWHYRETRSPGGWRVELQR